MTFDLRITRRVVWWEEREEGDLTPDEWLAAVAADDELELLGHAEGTARTGMMIRFASPMLAAWTSHPKGDEVWLDFAEGSVIVSDPDEATIEKMRRVAESLGASIQDNDGHEWPSSSM